MEEKRSSNMKRVYTRSNQEPSCMQSRKKPMFMLPNIAKSSKTSAPSIEV